MKEHESREHNKQATAWIQELIHLSSRKIVALMRNDLADLEQSLEEEERLLSLRPALDAGASVSKSALEELRDLNQRSRALVESGFAFTRTMLDAIHPPTTYSALVSGRTPENRSDDVSKSLLSVKC